MRITKDAAAESRDIGLVQEWESSRERCDASPGPLRSAAAGRDRLRCWPAGTVGRSPLWMRHRAGRRHGDSGAGGGRRQPAPRRVLRGSGETTGRRALNHHLLPNANEHPPGKVTAAGRGSVKQSDQQQRTETLQ